MANEIAEAISSATSLTSKLQKLRGIEDYGDLLQAAASVQEKLAQALIANATGAEDKMLLLQENQRLSKENEQLKSWAATSADYALESLGHGALAYVYKPQVQTTKPPHWACTKCFSDQVASILQRKLRVGYICPRCNLTLDDRILDGARP